MIYGKCDNAVQYRKGIILIKDPGSILYPWGKRNVDLYFTLYPKVISTYTIELKVKRKANYSLVSKMYKEFRNLIRKIINNLIEIWAKNE